MIDTPDARKMHTSPIPRIGGLAIWLALWASTLVVTPFILSDPMLAPASTLPSLSAIFAAAMVIFVVGMADDRRSSTPLAKLVGQFVACSILVVSGIRFSVFNQPLIDIPLTYLWVLGLTNALNLLDNMDGLSAGAATIAGAFLLLLAILNGQLLVALLAVAVVGSCLGFLLYNYNPASIFMGDTGSLSLGFILAVISMKLEIHNSKYLSFFIAALVLSVPIFDTSFVVWRRLTEGRSIAQGGKDDTSHRLVNLGLGQKQAVWVLYAASVLAGLAALVVSQGSRRLVVVMLVSYGILAIGAALLLARVRTETSQSSDANARSLPAAPHKAP